MPTPAEILDLRQAAKLSSLVPVLSDDIAAMRHTIDMRAFEAIRKGTLTADQALSLWHEAHAAHRLLKRFEDHARTAASVTETQPMETI